MVPQNTPAVPIRLTRTIETTKLIVDSINGRILSLTNNPHPFTNEPFTTLEAEIKKLMHKTTIRDSAVNTKSLHKKILPTY